MSWPAFYNHWPERDDELRALWAAGHATAEIGRRMRITKNAVIGRAHRLGLPARPSPITGLVSPRAPRPVKSSERSHLNSRGRAAASASVPSREVSEAMPREVGTPRLLQNGEATLATVQTPARPVAPPRVGPARECCWPIGDPRARNFRFCCEASLPGRSYCEAHFAVAYVRVRPAEVSDVTTWE